MRSGIRLIQAFLIITLASCQAAAPPSNVPAVIGEEIILATQQSAVIRDAGLTVKLIGVSRDDRCPAEVECVVSGPVTISLEVTNEKGKVVDLTLQTFTDGDGRSPAGQFEGIQNQQAYEGYLIRLLGVSPYPRSPTLPIKPADYRVTLTVEAHQD